MYNSEIFYNKPQVDVHCYCCCCCNNDRSTLFAEKAFVCFLNWGRGGGGDILHHVQQ